MFKGSMVALVTPMHENGSLDKRALNDLLEWHIDSKTDAIIVAGTTGESVTLNSDEQYELVSLVVKQIRGRIPVIAGTGTNSTQVTIKLSENAKKAGVDALLIVTPYYNKPPQNGLYQHFKTVADNIKMPIILYNVPGRTACDILPETVFRLSKIEHIIGIKEATGEVERTQEIIERCGASFEVYSGDDPTGLDLMLNGAKGIISVTANVAPDKMHQMCDAAYRGDAKSAQAINAELSLLHQRLFLESNPIPTKWALHKMNKIGNGIRLPLVPLDAKFHLPLTEALLKAGIKIETELTEA